MIRSVWQQKGQLLGQLLSRTHRRLPLADARSAAKQAVQTSIRNRMKSVKSRTSTFGQHSRIPAPSAAAVAPGAMAAAPVAKHEDPLHGDVDQLTESPRSSMQHDSPRLSHSSSRSYSSAEDEQLPFDIAAAELVHPEVELDHHKEEGVGETYEPFSQATQQREAVEAAGGDRNSPVMVAEPDSIDDQEHAVEERARHDQHERESRDGQRSEPERDRSGSGASKFDSTSSGEVRFASLRNGQDCPH